MCIYCLEHEAPGGRGYCPSCLFLVRAEIEDGLVKLTDYLQGWAQFGDWCAERGLTETEA